MCAQSLPHTPRENAEGVEIPLAGGPVREDESEAAFCLVLAPLRGCSAVRGPPAIILRGGRVVPVHHRVARAAEVAERREREGGGYVHGTAFGEGDVEGGEADQTHKKGVGLLVSWGGCVC